MRFVAISFLARCAKNAPEGGRESWDAVRFFSLFGFFLLFWKDDTISVFAGL